LAFANSFGRVGIQEVRSVRTPIIFSYGMGLDSATILARWCNEPAACNFDLADLIIVSAQPGGESAETKEQNERLLLPLMRQHGIRFVQIGRAGPSQRDGIAVLSDTREPAILHTEGGPWTLYDEMIQNGTVPQFAAGKRTCSHKFKTTVIESWLKQELGGQPYRHCFGYAADEQKRINRAIPHQRVGETMEFPLSEWGWDRAACAAYSLAVFGEVISRSCCGFCPFAESCGGKGEMMERYHCYPGEAVQTLILEHLARALNPRMSLYPSGRTALSTVQASGNAEALRRYHDRLNGLPWAVYHVERLYRAKGITDRRLSVLETGNQADMRSALAALARAQNLSIERDEIADRAIVRQRTTGYPATEEFYVVAPALAKDKARKRFEVGWTHTTMQQHMF
jgi:hypothetical protein